MSRRVLWIGDAGCHTGFGRVTHSIGDRLVNDHGHSLDVLAINHRGDPWPTRMRLWPATLRNPMDTFGKSRVGELIAEVDPEVVVILHDPEQVFGYFFRNQKFDPTNSLLTYAPVITYTPIDGVNNPPSWDHLSKFSTRVTMSKFGQDQVPGSELIYHGVDTDLYHPATAANPIAYGDISITSKTDAKKAFGLDPDGFFVLRVDRNSLRKNYPDTWRALVPVMQKHTDIQAHFHCMARGDSFDMPNLLSRDPGTADRFKFPPEETHNTFVGWPDAALAALYNAADVFVSTSWGEGFGLTIAEAMACGTPVIAQDCSAITEVVGPGGILIEPERHITVATGQDQWLPNVPAFTEAIEKLYLSRGARKDLGRLGREHVVDSYSWDRAAVGFSDLIERLASGTGKDTDAGAADTADVQDRDGRTQSS